MSYYDPYQDFDYGQMDPNDPAMIQALLESYMGGDPAFADVNAPAFDQGQMEAMYGLISPTQPSGKPMTPSNITGALSAYRTGMFDPAFMGLGGADAFAADAFEPTTSTSIVQTPELQQMYGYLRAPDSYEGLIANEILNGGNASTALRKIRQLLADENTDPTLRSQLLLELPQRAPMEGAPAPEVTVENVNWDAGDDSVAGRAREINELYAQVPRVGASGPKWDPNTGQQLSAGGELQWSTDETGAPVMIEVTTEQSPLAEKYHALGLPYPTDEYMAEDFMPGEWGQSQAAFEQQVVPAYQQAMQQWVAAQEAGQPTMQPLTDYDIPNLTEDQLAGRPQSSAAPQDYGNASLLDVMRENPSGDTGGVANSLLRQGLWDIITGNEGEGQPGGGPREADALNAVVTTGTLGGNLVADSMLQNPSGDTSGVWGSLSRQGLWDIITGNEGDDDRTMRERVESGDALGPPAPQQPAGPNTYGGTSPATYEQFLSQNPPITEGTYTNTWGPTGNPFAPYGLNQQYTPPPPPYAQPGAMPARQPGDASWKAEMGQPPPVMIDGKPNPEYQVYLSTVVAPQYLPPYARPGAQPANQPGGPAYMEAVETGERRADQRREDEQQAQILGGSTVRGRGNRHPTRSPEQARAFRTAQQDYNEALRGFTQAKAAVYNEDYGRALSQAGRLRSQGVRPLDQVLMARRLVMMGAGMPSGRIPGL